MTKLDYLYSRRINLCWKSHFHFSLAQPNQMMIGLEILPEMCKQSFTNVFQVKMLKSTNLHMLQQKDPCCHWHMWGKDNNSDSKKLV